MGASSQLRALLFISVIILLLVKIIFITLNVEESDGTGWLSDNTLTGDDFVNKT